MRFDCAQTEIVFLRKRLAQLEERLESELGTRTGLEHKASAGGPGHGGDRGSPGSHQGAGLLLELVVLSTLPGWVKLPRAEAQQCSRLLLVLFPAGLRINTPKFPSSLKKHLCTRKCPNSTLLKHEQSVRRGSVVGLGFWTQFGVVPAPSVPKRAAQVKSQQFPSFAMWREKAKSGHFP